MKRLLLTFAALALLTFNVYSEESKSNEPSTSIVVSMTQDPCFGFYPSVWGSLGLSNKTDFTFYGTFWTQDALAGYNGGINLLTEFGAGVNFKLMDGALTINPQLGFGNGKYESGQGRIVVGDNIVPNVAISYSTGNLVLPFSAYYWKHLREESKNAPYIDQIQYTFMPGYTFSKYVTAGVYYDHYLVNTDAKDYNDAHPQTKMSSSTITNYLWLGPYCKFTVKSGASFWFTGGVDLSDYTRTAPRGYDKKIKDFYKMSVSFPF